MNDDRPDVITKWMARNGTAILRMAMGVIFVWFGFLKYFPALNVADDIAPKTILSLFPWLSEIVAMRLLATVECLIGLGLLTGYRMKITLFLLFSQMLGTLLPLILLPGETWSATPFVPTLLGQYIIKNVVLISGGIVIGATADGGKIVADPVAAQKDAKRDGSG